MSNLYMDKDILAKAGDPYTRKSGSGNTEFVASQGHEPKIVTINEGRREGTSVLEYPNKFAMPRWQRTPHPTQKPLDMYELLIKAYCPPDGIVYDPCAGSGTAAVAAKRAGRKYCCIEIDKEYYDVMRRRLESMIY